MIGTALLNVLVMIPSAMLFFLPTITALPLGIDPAVQFFTGTIRGVINTFPWLDVVYNLFLLGLFLKFALFSFEMVIKIISMIRG